MNSIPDDWRLSFEIIENQINAFNVTVQASDKLEEIDAAYQSEELERIYRIVKKEIARLTAFTNQVDKRLAALEDGCFGSSRRAIILTGILAGCSEVTGIAGGALGVWLDNPIGKGIGFGVFVLASLFTWSSTIYQTKISLDQNLGVELELTMQKGLAQAKVFQKFIKTLKSIKKIEKQQLEQLRKVAEEKTLDVDIHLCLQQYENLGSHCKDEVYFRLLSLLIHQLPEEDPLKVELSQFTPISPSRVKDLSSLAQKPLSINYLPNHQETSTSGTIHSTSDSNSSIKSADKSGEDVKIAREDELKEDKWTGEQDGRFRANSQKKTIQSLQSKDKYATRLGACKQMITQRFKIEKAISFIDIEDGIRLTEEGYQSIPSLNDNEQNSLPPRQQQTSDVIIEVDDHETTYLV